MTAPQPAEDGHPQEKRMNPRRLRQTMYWLALDWIHLRTTTPTLPVQRLQDISRSSNVKTYGHPAEWQSDNAADIVEKLTGWHDYLADQRNETAPPTGCESRRLVAAWKYLEPRCEQLTELVEHEALTREGTESSIAEAKKLEGKIAENKEELAKLRQQWDQEKEVLNKFKEQNLKKFQMLNLIWLIFMMKLILRM